MYNIMCEVVRMDSQLKKGLIEVCVLASLKDEDSYGYKIISDLPNFIEMSESTLYPILKRLETSKFVITYSKEYNGRLRKYYSITLLGKKRINEFREDWMIMEKIYKYIDKGSR